MNVDVTSSALQSGGNLEGKEVRFGSANSALWATATTAASNGAVNSMHDSFTPLGGLVPLWLMELGEVVFGGVGSGLYGMLAFVIIAVFVAGLMVGRTPEYLGKKIEVHEMKMAALIILIPLLLVLFGTALAVAVGRSTVFNPGAHGFSEILYAFSSASNNNGSAFAGLGTNTVFYNIALAVADVPRPLLAGHSGAGDRGVAGAEEETACFGRDPSHAYSPLHFLACRRGHNSRCPQFPPCPLAWADSRAPDDEIAE